MSSSKAGIGGTAFITISFIFASVLYIGWRKFQIGDSDSPKKSEDVGAYDPNATASAGAESEERRVRERDIIWKTMNAGLPTAPEDDIARLGYALDLILSRDARTWDVNEGLLILLMNDADASGGIEDVVRECTTSANNEFYDVGLLNLLERTEYRVRLLRSVLGDRRRLDAFRAGKRIPLESATSPEEKATDDVPSDAGIEDADAGSDDDVLPENDPASLILERYPTHGSDTANSPALRPIIEFPTDRHDETSHE